MLNTMVPRSNRLLLSTEQSDRQVLACFSATCNQAAFALLVQRNERMVLSVCWRMLHHWQDAEDAFQRTFLVLIRNAVSIRDGGSLRNWLYGVARRTASEVRRERERRKKLVRQSAVAPPKATNDVVQDPALLDLLNSEVQRLPKKLRSCFVAYCLEGKSKSKTALELGLKEGTVASRAAQARKILQRRLAQRGITPW